MDLDFEKLGQGGFGLALLYLLYYVGTRLVTAVDKLSTKLDEHTKLDIQAQNEVRHALVALQTRIDTIAELTPVEGVPRQELRDTRSGPVRTDAGVYGLSRAKTRG
jgi:hypothetical protein